MTLSSYACCKFVYLLKEKAQERKYPSPVCTLCLPPPVTTKRARSFSQCEITCSRYQVPTTILDAAQVPTNQQTEILFQSFFTNFQCLGVLCQSVPLQSFSVQIEKLSNTHTPSADNKWYDIGGGFIYGGAFQVPHTQWGGWFGL